MALALGGIAPAGALAAAEAAFRRQRVALPRRGPVALSGAETGTLQLPGGEACYYHRPGAGTPVVLLHSLNAAASSFEMQPVFQHLAATARRPLYAMDWLGFGGSERPDLRYTPALYVRQLQRFLDDVVGGPADVVALSLGCEYAAEVAVQEPRHVRRFLGIAPTALNSDEEGSLFQRWGVDLAARTGLFGRFFARLTRRRTLARFYRKQIFLDGGKLPHALVDHACATTQVQGAARAPRYFVQGALFTYAQARRAYAALRVPTCFVLPEDASSTIQRFDRAEAVAARNAAHITLAALPSGLMPHWEDPDLFFPLLDGFLEDGLAGDDATSA